MDRRPHRRPLGAVSLAVALAMSAVPRIHAAPVTTTRAQSKNCSRTSFGLTPLNDLGAGTYQGVEGGLYDGGSNQCPFAHQLAGLRIARAMVPLDTTGAVDRASGRIVMVSLGGNNASLDFAAFIADVASDPTSNPKLLVVNGAASGTSLPDAADPQSAYWDAVAASLRAAGSAPAQVQVAWMKLYVEAALGSFATSTDSTAKLLTRAVRNARARLPNLRLLYLTPRMYSGYTDDPDLTEPNAYWTGFAHRQVILSQASGDSLNFDPARGAVVAPWIDWGPYLWADGIVPRSDGLTWPCSAYTGNGYVPSQSGRAQFADSLLAFLQDAVTAAPWYLASSALDVPADPGAAVGSATLVVAPNPVASSARLRVTAAPGAWSLRVMDLQGRVRREFSGSGAAEVAWDLRDERGARVAAGVYWARLLAPAGSATKTIIVR